MNSFIPISLIGISHKTAPVDIRECVAFSAEEQKEAIRILLEEFDIEGCMILSTCNRTEIYFCGDGYKSSIPGIRSRLDVLKSTSYFQDDNLTYIISGEELVTHFFKVASGLDSMIIGEPQITGQVKQAYEVARELNSTNTLLNKLYNYALQTEKKVRTDTYLTDGAVSVSFAGVELARKIFTRLEKKNVLLIGAGETAELAALHFREKGIHTLHIANRTESKARELAEKLNGIPFPMEDLEAAFTNIDIVISATASTSFVISEPFAHKIIRGRHLKPLFLIDLAVPRDIDPDIDKLDGVYLYNLDDLQDIVQSNLEKRKAEIPKALKVVEEYTGEFRKWMSTHSVASTINRLKQYFDEIRLSELNRLKKRLPQEGLPEIEYLTQSIMNKVMHQHIKSLKKNASDPKLYQEHIDFVYNLYELDQE